MSVMQSRKNVLKVITSRSVLYDVSKDLIAIVSHGKKRGPDIIFPKQF